MEHKNKTSIVIYGYRLERWFYKRHLTILAKLFYHMIQILFGCTIPYSAELEEGVNIAHFHGIVIHQKSKVGSGTVIFQNVCLGERNGKGGPTIGKNCIIGAGACVLGEIEIGDNVSIGANAVVLTDVPSNATVVGVPGRIIMKDNKV